jgi:hypothetical protein
MTKKEDYITRSMQSLSSRVKKGEQLLASAHVFAANRNAFSADFELFFEALITFVTEKNLAYADASRQRT